jgi:hypothetical protein
MVSRLATAKAAMRVAVTTHRPRSLANVAALDSDPLIWPARSLVLATVRPGSR